VQRYNGAVTRALGISPHTGWAACVVVGGTLRRPEIVANQVVDVLGDAERFLFHMAADMKRAQVEKFIAATRRKALAAAKRALKPLLAEQVSVCAIVARPGDPGDLDHILAAHPRLHTAEGCFYRDIFRDACTVPVELVPPKSLDISGIGKLAPAPWGRDQKLAALAAWTALRG
jgi:hypothetical protein